MATVVNYGWYLGVLPDIETDPNAILGTYGAPGATISDSAVSVSATATGNQTVVDENQSNEGFTLDTGSGPVFHQLEEMALYNVDYVLKDGTTGTTQLWVVQSPSGETVLLMDADADSDVFQTEKVESFTLTSFVAGNYSWQTLYHTEAVMFCLAAGTPVDTPRGAVAVERLRPGDLVETLDRGPQPVRFVRRQRMSGQGRGAPIRINPGVLGQSSTLWLSQQHRVLLAGPWAELMLGTPEVLVPAKALLGLEGVARIPRPRISYHHLTLDRHEVLRCAGAHVESLFAPQSGHRAARPFCSVREGRLLASLWRRSVSDAVGPAGQDLRAM